MRVSVVFSTFNSPDWLQKVLWGYEFQTHRDFEIVVADDGSGPDTAEMIDRMRIETGLEIQHVWHEDIGFRKCRILNQAILKANNDYIVFSDGDCIPRKDFLSEHVLHSEPGCYLSGSYFKLPMSTSEAITRADIASGDCFDLNWLKLHGLKPGRKHRKLKTPKSVASWFNRLTPTRCNFKGSNASAWKQDLLAVNGYDERMGWGGEDRELGIRLQNYGIKARHVRYNAICIHLDHARGYRDPSVVSSNKALRKASQQNKVVRTNHGIEQLQLSA